MVNAKISRATKIAPAQIAMSTAFSNIYPSSGPRSERRQPPLLQGHAIECLILAADEQNLVALEHFRTRLVRLDHDVVRMAEVIVDLRARRMARRGAAGRDPGPAADEAVEPDRTGFVARHDGTERARQHSGHR